MYVREIWIGVREKSGKCQGILYGPVCMNPVKNQSFVFEWPLKFYCSIFTIHFQTAKPVQNGVNPD